MTNLEKYRSLLHDGVQGLLLTSRYSRMYAAEFDIAEGVAVVSAQGARYFTDSRYIEAARQEVQGAQDMSYPRNAASREEAILAAQEALAPSQTIPPTFPSVLDMVRHIFE